MIRKSGARGDGEMVKHEEWREIAKLWGTDRSSDAGANTLGLIGGEEGLLNCAWRGHIRRLGSREESWRGDVEAEEAARCRSCGAEEGRAVCRLL